MLSKISSRNFESAFRKLLVKFKTENKVKETKAKISNIYHKPTQIPKFKIKKR